MLCAILGMTNLGVEGANIIKSLGLLPELEDISI
jgi:hypothetical protein